MFKESPHLRNVLSRKFTQIPLELDQAFNIAKDLGGNQELDFKREEGVSFNPRSARIVLILLEGNEAVETELIKNALLSSCIKEDSTFPDDVVNILSSDCIAAMNSIKKSMAQINQRASSLILEEDDSFMRCSTSEISDLLDFNLESPNAQILISLFIDRMRHSHLAKSESKTDTIMKRVRESFYYECLSMTYFSYYTPFIKAWRNRFYSKIVLR